MKQVEVTLSAGLEPSDLLTRIEIIDRRIIEGSNVVHGDIVDIYEETWQHHKGVKYLVLHTDVGYTIKLTVPTSTGSEPE